MATIELRKKKFFLFGMMHWIWILWLDYLCRDFWDFRWKLDIYLVWIFQLDVLMDSQPPRQRGIIQPSQFTNSKTIINWHSNLIEGYVNKKSIFEYFWRFSMSHKTSRQKFFWQYNELDVYQVFNQIVVARALKRREWEMPSIMKLSRFSFPKLSKFSFPNCQNFPFQTLKYLYNFHSLPETLNK
jgi:hypothetical protein